MGKYRQYSAAFKTERVLEVLSGVKTPAERRRAPYLNRSSPR